MILLTILTKKDRKLRCVVTACNYGEKKITHNFIKIRNALHKLSVNVQTAFKTRCLSILEEYYRSEDVGEVLR